MSKRAAKKGEKQVSISRGMWVAMQQLALPMFVASEAIQKGLLAFVQSGSRGNRPATRPKAA